jgi:peptidoglycan/xylan/chitin deacetylase (PgdA/CDA1 family)
VAEGHTIGSHTFSHSLLDRMRPDRAEAEINQGIAAVEKAAYGTAREPATRFFRFPGFASSPGLLDRLAARHIVVFGADLWASDWEPMSPGQELHLVLARIEKQRRGIVLLHDTKKQTAAMLPGLLRELKARGYRVVHAVPAGAAAASLNH